MLLNALLSQGLLLIILGGKIGWLFSWESDCFVFCFLHFGFAFFSFF